MLKTDPGTARGMQPYLWPARSSTSVQIWRAARVWTLSAGPPPIRTVCVALAWGAAPASSTAAAAAPSTVRRVSMIRSLRGARVAAGRSLARVYLTRRETALNSGVPAASNHSNSTISVVTREIPNAPNRASAASLLAGARELQASATM